MSRTLAIWAALVLDALAGDPPRAIERNGFRVLTADHSRIAARSPDDDELLATRLRKALADG